MFAAKSRGINAAKIAAIETSFPEQVLDNKALAALYPDWSEAKILEKTGIEERRVAGKDETALDLAERASRALLERTQQKPDFIILCTQAPDYILPTSACILQHRLGLPTSTGALDINLGCSGFVYGLSLATGLIASGAASSIMLVTADTYSKFINPLDRSVRTLFGDGAAATLIVADDAGTASIGPFVFGTDGSGAGDLIVPAGGARMQPTGDALVESEDDFGNVRSLANLYMNGSAVLNFTLKEVPRAFQSLQERTGRTADDFDYVVLHQANKFMLDTLRRKLKLPVEKTPYHFKHIGNTVSSTIPCVLKDMMSAGTLQPGKRIALIGFGVGLSWAAAAIDT